MKGNIAQHFPYIAAPEPEGIAPEFTTALPEELQASLGEKLEMKVEVTGIPQPKISWLIDEEPLEESEKYLTECDGEAASLVISSVSEDDDALFTCIVENDIGKCECSCDVLVTIPGEGPKFSEILKPMSVLLDEEAEFRVALEDAEETKVTWFVNDKQIKNRGRYRIYEEKNGVFVFVVEKCKLTDCGVVKCVAADEDGEISCTAELMVAEKGSVPVLKAISETVGEFMSGDSAKLEALISGNPTSIDWLKGFKKLSESSEKYEMEVSENKFALIVKDLKLEDSGTYKCIASNAVGENSLSFTIKVKGKMKI